MAYNTLDEIRAGCVECGDCWEWKGYAAKCGTPKVNTWIDGRRNVFSGRRVVMHLVGKQIPKGVVLTTKCGNPRCLNPDHIIRTTRSEVATKVAARVDIKLKKAARSGRPIKLDQQKVADIRSSTMKNRELAALYGVTISTISRTRNGHCWAQRNPFAGLMA